MASREEIEKELKLALEEVGPICPYFDDEVKEWVFSHHLYPVECGGKTSDEVIERYPLYLREFIIQRLLQNLNPDVEEKTKGRGGQRTGAGRPKGSYGVPKSRIYLPEDIAVWLQDKDHLQTVRMMAQASSFGNKPQSTPMRVPVVANVRFFAPPTSTQLYERRHVG